MADQEPGREGTLDLALKALLLRLEAEELQKPLGQRRAVPTAVELAQVAGVHRATIYGYLSGDVKRLNLEAGAAILSELWRRGFLVGVSDLLIFHPPTQANGG